MNAVAAAVLKSREGVAVPLKGVTARGRLAGLLFELTVEQHYENSGDMNIEAEYTFPLPHRAVLLGVELSIGGRELKAVAVRRQTARERYEEAIDEGNTAVLLEQSGDGLYSLSLGNLMADEQAVIRYRYAELLDRSGDDVRLMIPTVIAPRYGDPAAHGLQPHQAPGVDLLAAYPFALEIDVEGDMARATLASPSHRIVTDDTATGRHVRLDADAWLDRDFILTVTGVQTRSASVVARDGDGYVALLSLDPQIAGSEPEPLALKILVDCSGSMGGDSIRSARRALAAILDRLDERDHVSITRFGSEVEHIDTSVMQPRRRGYLDVFGRGERQTPEQRGGMAAATPAVVARLRHRMDGMEADLGGTEMAAALRSVMAIPAGKAAVKNVLLITDAEVWAVEQVLSEATRSRHRLFVVAVGAAPAEPLARQLAARTGGACEFVAPSENVEGAIVRMFRRMRETPRHVAHIEWPAAPLWQAPLPAAVFAGDTLHLMAGFTAAPAGKVGVQIAGGAGENTQLQGELGAAVEHDVLPRLAAAKRLASLDDEEAAALAERYQLASVHTSFVVVQVRDAEGRATELPELRAVPQMLAAGWGGAGVADLAESCLADPVAAFHRPAELMTCAERRVCMSPRATDSLSDISEHLDDHGDTTPGELLDALSELLVRGDTLPSTIDEIALLDVPRRILDALYAVRNMVDPLGFAADTEARIVRVWIALLARSPAGDELAPEHRAALKATVLAERGNRAIRSALSRIFGEVSVEEWAVVPAFATPA